jgi:hypothetical protein
LINNKTRKTKHEKAVHKEADPGSNFLLEEVVRRRLV